MNPPQPTLQEDLESAGSRAAQRRGVRFGLGQWDGLRSSTWKVWAGRDSSVYVACRDVGASVKVSLHPTDTSRPGSDSRVAWTSEYMAAHPELDDRVVASWGREDCLLPDAPVLQGFAVILGRFSLGLNRLPDEGEELVKYRRGLQGVRWVEDLPPINEACQFTVLLTQPGVRLTNEIIRLGSAEPIGGIRTDSGSQAWVMMHRIPVTDDLRDRLLAAFQAGAHRYEAARGAAVADIEVLRAHILGYEADGLQWIAECAATSRRLLAQ